MNYSFGLTRNVFAIVGLGYFNQRFGIKRGFDFYEPNSTTGLFYTTNRYSYSCVNYFGGLGFRTQLEKKRGKIIKTNSDLRFSAIVNIYNTYQQEFKHDFGANFLGNPNPQIRKNSYQYGTSIQLMAGILRPVYKNFKIGIDIAVPAYNRLKKDEIFREDPQKLHGVNISIGTSINLIYDLKNL